MSNAYTTAATLMHGYALWPKPSSDHNILIILLLLYSWIVIMSPWLALMLIIRYLRNH